MDLPGKINTPPPQVISRLAHQEKHASEEFGREEK